MGKEEKKPSRDKPPRPRNAWMLFLCAYHDERKAMREPPLIDPETAKHTKIVSERWKNLPMSEKEKWHAKAEQEKEEHAARYPGYKYQPSKHKKQRTFYGGPKAQRKMQGLVQTAQAKIQQDIGGRLIWIDVAENGKSIAGPVELYDAPQHSTIPPSAVGVHPYDHLIVSAPHSPIYLKPVAQYAGPPSERTNSVGPDSDEDDVYGSGPPESDWENDYVDEDDAELQTPDSASYPRRGSDPLRIVMTVQNRLGTLTEVDAGAAPSDPERPLSPPIPVMQLIRESRGVVKSTSGGQRHHFASGYPSFEEVGRYTILSDAPSGRERSHSTPTLYSSLPPSPQFSSSFIRSARALGSPAKGRPQSSDRYTSGPPLASPVAPPLSAQPYTRSPYHTHSYSLHRRSRDHSQSHSRYVAYPERVPHSAHPYYRPPDSRLYTDAARRPSGPAWLPPPGFSPPPVPTVRRPTWLPPSTRPAPLQREASMSRPSTPPLRVKEEDLDEDICMIEALDNVPGKQEPDCEEDTDQLDDDQYPVHQPRLASDVAANESLRSKFQLAPIRSPPSSPKGDTRLPPIQIPRTPSPNLSPRSLPASAYLKGPVPGSLGQYSPHHTPPASAGSSMSRRFRPVKLSAVDIRERAAQDSRAASSVVQPGLSHASTRQYDGGRPEGTYRRERDGAYPDDKRHSSSGRRGVSDYPQAPEYTEHHVGQTPRIQPPTEPNSASRSSPVAESVTYGPGADSFTLRPARF